MYRWKILIVFCVLMLHLGNASYAQQPDEAVAVDTCHELVSPEEAFASIKVTDASLKPGPVHIRVEVRVDDNAPCVTQHVTPVVLYYSGQRLRVRVTRNEDEPNIRFALMDRAGEFKGGAFDVAQACATYIEGYGFEGGCGPPD